MSDKTPQRPGRKPKPPIKEGQVQGTQYLSQILELLAPLHEHRADPKRELHYDELCAWMLLYFFTPILTSMRGLQQASMLEQVRRRMNLPRFSLGSFSEAMAIFDPSLLEPIMAQINGRLEDIAHDQRLHDLGLRPVAVDGTLLHALPRMVRALWLDAKYPAAKLHLQLDLLRGTPEYPCLSGSKSSEARALQDRLAAGRLYITDRGYFDYELYRAVMQACSSFVGRVRSNISYKVLEERPISPEAQALGVTADLLVLAGWEEKSGQSAVEQPLRLVRIHVPNSPPPRGGIKPNRVDSKSKLYRTTDTEHDLLLLTDLLDLDLELLALLYRNRWQIEIFFRWFKKVLQANRPLAESAGGMTIVIYCALIASQLVVLWTGKQPTKRTFELLCFYFLGLVSDEELLTHLARLKDIKDAAPKI